MVLRSKKSRSKQKKYGGHNSAEIEAHKAGLVKKLSTRHSIWQRRYIRLETNCFVYGSKRSGEVRIELSTVVGSRLLNRYGDFVIEFAGERVLTFRCRGGTPEATEWITAVKEGIASIKRATEAEKRLAKERQDDVANDHDDSLLESRKSGWLLKPSSNSYFPKSHGSMFQRRFCRIGPDGCLSYHRDETAPPLASIALDAKTVIQLSSESKTCCDFFIRIVEEGRDFVFRASTPDEAKEWIQAVNKAARQNEWTQKQRDQVADELNSTEDCHKALSQRLALSPAEIRAARRRIRAWDSIFYAGDQDSCDQRRLAKLQKDLDSIFIQCPHWYYDPESRRLLLEDNKSVIDPSFASDSQDVHSERAPTVDEVASTMRALHAATALLAGLVLEATPRRACPGGRPDILAAYIGPTQSYLWSLAEPALQAAVAESKRILPKKATRKEKNRPSCPDCDALAAFDEKCARWPECSGVRLEDNADNDPELAALAARTIFPTVSDRISLAGWTARHRRVLVDAVAALDGAQEAQDVARRSASLVSAYIFPLCRYLVWGPAKCSKRSKRRNKARVLRRHGQRCREVLHEDTEEDRFASDAASDSEAPPSDRLRVCLVRGKNLAVRDTHITGGGGSSDPRVHLSLGNHGTAATSSVKRATLEPVWRECFDLTVPQMNNDLALICKCEDWDDVSACDAMGHCRIPLAPLLKQPLRRCRDWFPLQQDAQFSSSSKVLNRLASLSGPKVDPDEELGEIELVLQWLPLRRNHVQSSGFAAQMHELCCRVRTRQQDLGLDAVLGGGSQRLHHTTAPSDVWNVLSQHVGLALEAQAEELGGIAIGAAFATAAAFCRSIARALNRQTLAMMHKNLEQQQDDDDESDDDTIDDMTKRLAYLSACCNDSVTHQERAAEMLKQAPKVNADDVYTAAGILRDAACAGIAELAASDLSGPLKKELPFKLDESGRSLLFSAERTSTSSRRRSSTALNAEAPVIEVVLATLSDYAEDLSMNLDGFVYVKSVSAMQRRACAEYAGILFDRSLSLLSHCEINLRRKRAEAARQNALQLKRAHAATKEREIVSAGIEPSSPAEPKKSKMIGGNMKTWLQNKKAGRTLRQKTAVQESALLAAKGGTDFFDTDDEESEDEDSTEGDEESCVGAPPAPDAAHLTPVWELAAARLVLDADTAEKGFAKMKTPPKRAAAAVLPMRDAAAALRGTKTNQVKAEGLATAGHEALRAACVLLRLGADAGDASDKAAEDLKEACHKLASRDFVLSEQDIDHPYAFVGRRLLAGFLVGKRRVESSTGTSHKRSLKSMMSFSSSSPRKGKDEKSMMGKRMDDSVSEAECASLADDTKVVSLDAMLSAAELRLEKKREELAADMRKRQASTAARLRGVAKVYKKIASEIAVLEGWAEKRSNGVVRQYQRRYFCVEEEVSGGLDLAWRRKFPDGERVGGLALAPGQRTACAELDVHIICCAEALQRDQETGMYERSSTTSSQCEVGPQNLIRVSEANFVLPGTKSRRHPAPSKRTKSEESQFEPFLSDDGFPDASPNELRIGLVRGSDLAVKDKPLFSGVGTSDPRVRFAIVGTKCRCVSTTKRKTLQPVWHETFELPFNAQENKILLVRCEDWDEISASDKMGYCKIELESYSESRRTRQWYTLKPDSELSLDLDDGSEETARRTKKKKKKITKVSGALEIVIQSRYSEERALKSNGGLSSELELRFDTVDELLRWTNAFASIIRHTNQGRGDTLFGPEEEEEEELKREASSDFSHRNEEATSSLPPPSANGEIQVLAASSSSDDDGTGYDSNDAVSEAETPWGLNAEPKLVPHVETLRGWLLKRSPSIHHEFQRRFCTLDHSARYGDYDLSWRREPEGPRLSVLPLRRGSYKVLILSTNEPVVFDARYGCYSRAESVRPTDRTRYAAHAESNVLVLRALNEGETNSKELELQTDSTDELLDWANNLINALKPVR